MIKYKLIILLFGFNSLLFSNPLSFKEYTASIVPQNMGTTAKKTRFYALLVPPIKKVHKKLFDDYLRVKRSHHYYSMKEEMKKLRLKYKVQTNEEVLVAMKPHPPSIVIAQAAMESAWGTSRFFREANNVFGMWSKNKNEPRIAAGVKRNGNYTVWLKKFDSIEDSIYAYYELLSKGSAYEAFRYTRYTSDDVFEMVKKLDKYSEIGHRYGEELSAMIRYNKLREYDK